MTIEDPVTASPDSQARPASTPPPPSRLGQFVVVRLLATGKPPARSDIDKSLKRYFADRLALTAGDWKTLLDGTLDELGRCGLIESRPYRLTHSGRQAALGIIGVDTLPPRTTWQALRNRYVTAMALGILPLGKSQLERLGKADGMRAAILAKHYRLPSGPVPTLSRALHELAWQQLAKAHELADMTHKDFTRRAVLIATLLEGRSVNHPEEALAAMATDASATKPEVVRDSLICQWLNGADSREVVIDRFDLKEFARIVRELAATSGEGRFGPNKVFIDTVWNRFQSQPGTPPMTRQQFDHRLVEANAAMCLTLSRADLVDAMDPESVRLSEIRLSDASFHFIRTDY